MAAVQGLPEYPLEWGEDVGIPRVSLHFLDAITGQDQVLLWGRSWSEDLVSKDCRFPGNSLLHLILPGSLEFTHAPSSIYVQD